MVIAGSMVEAHERLRLRDPVQADALLRDLFEDEVGELSGWQPGGLVLTLHRFRLNGVSAFALHCGSPLELSRSGRRYFGCIAPGLPFEIDGLVRSDKQHALIIAPGRRHRFYWPPGAVMLGCAISGGDMARYGGVAAAASGHGFGADGIMVMSLRQGPFRVLGGGLQLLAAALQLDLDPMADGAPVAAAVDAVPPVPRHVKRAEDYLARHLAEPLTMAELAARVGVSVRSLHRGFLDFRGVTPARYLLNLRIEAAHRLMISSECFLDLRQVATEVGFGSYAPFWRAYVRKYGRAPSSTRRLNGDSGPILDRALP